MYRRGLKRMLDIIIVLLSAPLVIVVCLVVACLIRARMGSPVLFRHRRPGLHECRFRMLKFRTMHSEAEQDGRVLRESERITRLGGLLRKTSLDELPQLWNVLCGDMSLVGPRPLLEEYLPCYTAEEQKRHLVRPGITGWAQVNGRNYLPADERLASDVWYVEHLSWALDLRIALKTVQNVLRCKDVQISPADNMQDFISTRRSRACRLNIKMANESWSVERARPGDGEAIARHLSRVISPGLNELSIWGSPLLARYLEETLSGRTPDNIKRELFVLRTGSHVGGAAALRTTPANEVWVDSVCVSPEARGGMRADLLLATAIRMVADATGTEWVVFDVFTGKSRLARWYDRMGCVEQERKGWWISPRDYWCECAKAGTVHGLAEADHQHSAWGFSMLDVETSVGRYRVGRLPGPYFRLTLPEIPRDPELFAALPGIDRNRRVFLVGPESMPDSGWERVAVARRMRGHCNEILVYLEAMSRLSDRKNKLAAVSEESGTGGDA